jgi:hypothetical protein
VELLDKVLLHVHDPTPHFDFNSTEAIQIQKTIMSFQAVLQSDDAVANTLKFRCGTLGLCNRWVHYTMGAA